MGERRNAYNILIRKSEGETTYDIEASVDIEMDLTQIGCGLDSTDSG
jgi:hypothetical protein